MVQKLENEISSDGTTATKNPPSPKTSKLNVLRRNKKPSNASDPFRFQGQGVSYKGKLIGEQDVTEARGDAMCSEAMKNAKAVIKAANAHKTRISLQINIEGIKIVDEKSNAVLHNFPVSRISFIARDTTDARAFGLIYGDSSKNYKFYGIKTAQAADQAVLAIRDMFQVVFEMKKKHIEQVKQQQTENPQEAKNAAVVVADLLDLETELHNIEQGVQQLQQIPTTDVFGATPFSDPFTDSFNSTASTHDTNGLNFSSSASNSFSAPTFQAPPVPQQQDIFAANFSQMPAPPAFAAPVLPQQNQMWPSANVSPPAPPMSQPVFQPLQVQPNTMFMQMAPPPQVPVQQLQYSSSNPFAQPTMVAADPFNVRPVPTKATPTVDWGVNENVVPQTNGFAAFDSQAQKNDPRWTESSKRVTSLEEAFSKLVDMDAIVGPSETKKNPFDHIINPPKASLNSLSSAPRAPAVATTADPFSDDFFR